MIQDIRRSPGAGIFQEESGERSHAGIDDLPLLKPSSSPLLFPPENEHGNGCATQVTGSGPVNRMI
ncbi:hypothetical protein FE257_008445 [Aspergillus nanangensis]|uniref:Uncharacterized protein n=1 Tax=Aspergillus nanangensis TaxID=2582783 RepID=A0AAD4GTG8_ASPNN|nr:hypothetical protein FE257_008445 [Aspergillus nanangensis]